MVEITFQISFVLNLRFINPSYFFLVSSLLFIFLESKLALTFIQYYFPIICLFLLDFPIYHSPIIVLFLFHSILAQYVYTINLAFLFILNYFSILIKIFLIIIINLLHALIFLIIYSESLLFLSLILLIVLMNFLIYLKVDFFLLLINLFKIFDFNIQFQLYLISRPLINISILELPLKLIPFLNLFQNLKVMV